jgi:autotransporter-associated beta strand protein/T5SS/PEP-CTERM-associated repeat protein
VGTNWNTGNVPGSGDRAIVNNGGTAAIETTVGNIQRFELGQTAGNSGLLELRENGSLTLTSGATYVGYSGTGELTIEPGAALTQTGSGFSVGEQAGSHGTVIQNGGMVSIGVFVNLAARDATAFGRYEIHGGTLTLTDAANGYLQIAREGTGEFVQTGGTVIVGRSTNSPALMVGAQGASVGRYEMSGGELHVTSERTIIGRQSTSDGTFLQTGGTVKLGNALVLAEGASTKGRWDLQGGELYATSIAKGSGTAQFNWSGGTIRPYGETGLAVSTILTLSGTGATFDTRDLDNIAWTITVSAGIGGNGSLTKQGEGTLVFAAAQDYTGSTMIDAGTLRLTGGTLATQSITVASAATLHSELSSWTYTCELLVDGGTFDAGTNNVDFNAGAQVTVNGTTASVTAGRLRVGTDSPTLSTFTQSGGTVTVAGTGPDLAVGHSGHGQYTQTGGTVSVARTTSVGANAGSDGKLVLQDDAEWTTDQLYVGNSGKGLLEIGDTAKLTVTTGGTQFIVGNSAGSEGRIVQTGGTVLQAGTGANYLGFSSGAIGRYEISGGTLDQGSLSVGGNSGGTGIFEQTGGDVIARRDIRVARGGGTGSYDISDGTLTVNNSSGVGDGRLYVGFDGSSSTATFTQSGGIVDALGGVQLGRLAGISGTYTMSGGELRVPSIAAGPGAAEFNWSGGIIRPRTGGNLGVTTPLTLSGTDATFDSSDAGGTGRTITVSAAIGGGGALTKNGAGTLILNADNSYAGATTVNAGTLSARHSNALGLAGAGTFVGSGATLELQGGITVAGEPLSGAGTVILRSAGGNNAWTGPAALGTSNTIDVTADTLTLSGVLSGGSVAKTGNGTLSITTAASTIDALSINQGVVALSDGADVTLETSLNIGRYSGQNGTLTVGDGTSILVAQYEGTGFYIGTSGTGRLTQTGGLVEQQARGAMYLGNNGTYEISGGTLDQGSLSIAQGAGTANFVQTGGHVHARRDIRMGRGGNAVYTMSGGTLTVDNTSGRENGVLSVGYQTAGSTGVFTQSGGTVDAMGLLLARESGVSGTYNMSGGELRVPTITAGPGAAEFNWSGGVIRPRSGGNLTVSMPLTLTGMGAAFDSSDAGGAARTITVSAAIGKDGGSWGLTKQGAGTLTLGAANTYTGATDIAAGTLKLGPAGSIAQSSAITIHPGATLDVADVTGGFSVAGGQTLAGSGTVLGDTALRTGAAVQPGMSIGKLTFQDNLTLDDGAVWDWEFVTAGTGGIDYDQIAGSSLILPADSGSTIAINVYGLPGHFATWYDEFTIFEGAVENFGAGLFHVENNSNWTHGWQVSLGAGGRDLVLTVIPEPGAWMLLLWAVMCALSVRRRH